MRIIVYGVGAIGGTVAAALTLSGQEVIGIARGAQLKAIQDDGLLLRTPEKHERAKFSCVSDPTEIDFRPDDAILLTMKTQDTLAALERLRTAGVTGQPLFCVQNGVTNERLALRLFPEVHGVTVIMPAAISAPGEIAAHSVPRHGIFDIGRYPGGSNAHDTKLAEALEAANIATFVSQDVMQSKYGKLILNLSNILQAALGLDADFKHLETLVRAEAEAAYRAAGIFWLDVGAADARRAQLVKQQPIAGIDRLGSSTTQSLARGGGSIETDYLNGEIVLLGRLHGVPVPVNTYFTELGARMAREGLKPGAVSVAQAEADLSALGAMPGR
ncbi:ketopantoate reductase family protein [Microvirga lotononidis]|uniref:2-dehydropantoate 2-reductase n=1 Tax=Microvirga lotononidis TaxID=864069 RepID=I4YQA9_9HYPH|nr:2-dehydropantoate 2-reductase N-terminal domain-containing protein [Microvirga lotononidis]EIM26151.1 ketopantoate reductase [Microvirga lotononidis]WQO26054.1 2-dehydropantoate 2-reductase N-terminal domain-containing protein [Microvirga lotononidis]